MANQSVDIIQAACEAFMRSMEEGRYYEAHEDLEVIWFPKRYDKSDEVRLWKGFINGAVSCELLRRGRTHPACRVWENYMKYRSILVTLESSYYEIYVKMDTLIQHRRKICLLS